MGDATIRANIRDPPKNVDFQSSLNYKIYT